MLAFLFTFSQSFLRRPLIQNQLSLPVGDNGAGCTLCENIVNDINSYIHNAIPIDQVTNRVKRYCEKVPAPYTAVCDVLADSYSNQIVSSLYIGKSASEICTNFKLCNNQNQKISKRVARLPTKTAESCTICVDLVNTASDLLKQGTTQSEIIQSLKTSCQKYPSDKPSCETLVNLFIPNYVLWIREPTASQDICATAFGFCDAQKSPKTQTIQNLEKVIARKPIHLPTTDNGAACTMCHNIVNDIVGWLHDHLNEAEIISKLNDFCDKVPAPYTQPCKTVAAGYVPFILAYLEQGVSVDSVCTNLGLCIHKHTETTANSHASGSKIGQARLPSSFDPEMNLGSSYSCLMCRNYVSRVNEHLYLDHQTEAQIQTSMARFCAAADKKFFPDCDTLTGTYIHAIVDRLQRDPPYTETKICLLLNMCDVIDALQEDFPNQPHKSFRKQPQKDFQKQSQKDFQKQSQKDFQKQSQKDFQKDFQKGLQAQNGQGCDMCHVVIDLCAELVEQGLSVDDILVRLQEECQKYPEYYADICETLMDVYVTAIVSWIGQGYTTEAICQTIGMCTKDLQRAKQGKQTVRVGRRSENGQNERKRPQRMLQMPVMIPISDNGEGCVLCRNFVTVISEIEGKSEQETISNMFDYCEKVPQPYGAVCMDLTNHWTRIVLSKLKEGKLPQEICQSTGICQNPPQKQNSEPKQNSLEKKPKSEENGKIACDVCSDFVAWLKGEIKEYSIPAVWKLVSKECPKIPYIKDFCGLITEQNIEMLVNMLLKKVSEQQICKLIKAC